MARYRLHEAWLDDATRRLGQLPAAPGELAHRLAILRQEGSELAADMDPERTIALRGWIERAMVLHQAICLGELANWQRAQGKAVVPESVVAHLLRLHPAKGTVAGPRWWPGRPTD